MSSAPPSKIRMATVSLAGCFGCHMSILDIDELLFPLLDRVELNRSPLTDLKSVGACDVGLVEGGVCNAENVEVLQEFRRQCTVLIAVGACAVNGGLPAQRNMLPLPEILEEVYHTSPGLVNGHIPNDPELPLPLNKVYPLHEIVQIDYSIPGCPPSAEIIWSVVSELLAGKPPQPDRHLLRYD